MTLLINGEIAVEGIICIRGCSVVMHPATAARPNEIQFDGSQGQRADLALNEEVPAGGQRVLTYEVFEIEGGDGCQLRLGNGLSTLVTAVGVTEPQVITASYAATAVSAQPRTNTICRIGNVRLDPVEA